MSVSLQRIASNMSEAEWEARCDLAALYRILHHQGMTDLIYTHMSARVPDEPEAFLINRYGEMFDEITASSLVKMDMSGRVLGEAANFNRAGFTIHSGVYKARPDVNCVMHTHTRPGTTVATLAKGLRPISQDVLEVYDELGYHPYGTPATEDEGVALGRSCVSANAVVLLNHGLLTMGHSIPAAYIRMYFLERACQIELQARALDEPPVLIDEAVLKEVAERRRGQRAAPHYGRLEWQSLLRMLERQGADYRR